MSEPPIVLAFHTFAPRERVRRLLGGLVGPAAIPLLLVGLGPGLTLYALEANPPFPFYALVLGVGTALFIVAAMVLDALLRPPAPFTIEVDETGVRETRGGVTKERGLSWVVGIARDGEALVLRVRDDEMRSFRLATTQVTALHVDARATSPETMARLERIFGPSAA